VRGFAGSALTEIEERGAPIGQTDQHESAAAQIPRERMGNRQREADGYCGIHRVTTPLEDRESHVGGNRFLGDDHCVTRPERVGAPPVGM
jgi:hypothetical protein